MFAETENREQAQSGFDAGHPPLRGNRFRAIGAHNRGRVASLLLLLTMFSFFLFGCPLYNPAAFIQHQTGPDDIASTLTQVTLQWDPPASGGAQVVSYTLSYRIHETSTWTTLAAAIPASSQPEYTVLRSEIGAGSFDFAVAAVDSNGISSPLHTSLDPTAYPTSGWYLSWSP